MDHLQTFKVFFIIYNVYQVAHKVNQYCVRLSVQSHLDERIWEL